MIRMSTIVAAAFVLGSAYAPGLAQTVTKTWVSSSTGNDTGTCQFITPCKTFAYAITQTIPGGELDVKDSGSYGPITITQAISIVSGDGVLAEISVPPGNNTGIVINAGTQDQVVLEGLTIDGHGTGTNGIVFNAAYSLTIENCHVRNVTQFGIALQPNGATLFNVVNTEVANAGEVGIILQPPSAGFSGVLSGIFAHDSTMGIEAAGPSNTTLVNSVISGNHYGVIALSPATISVGQTTVADNRTTGIYNRSGQIQTYGDNYINANGVDISGTVSGIARR